MKRRQFLAASTAAVALPSLGLAGGTASKSEPLSGIQIAPMSIFDEGVDRCLDRLQEVAAVNTLFIYSQTYHGGTKPKNVLATDHGIPVRDYSKSKLPLLWVRNDERAFAGKVVQHEPRNRSLEYGDRDVFAELQEPCDQRGMKIYARILEADARRADRIPGYHKVLTVDHEGKPGSGPCWNNPHYREWVFETIRQLATNYPLDGLQYGAERTGPLSHVLYRGLAPACFCEHCVRRNGELGIDATRAKEGFAKLFELMKSVSARNRSGRGNESPARNHDGVLTSAMAIIYRYPEVLRWDYEWFKADEEICTEVHRIAKSIRPEIDSGRHVDHQRSSWDFFYRSATSYSEMAENADFIKPIVYHDPMGPRLRWWVLERLKKFALADLTLEQSLGLYYSMFGHNAAEQPTLEELDEAGLGAEYVYRETLRCKQDVGRKAKVYAGIGIDVPWYVPGGMEPRPSDPDVLKAAVTRAFDAGADGVLASREYNEMRMSSLTAFGDAVRAR